MNVKRCTIGWLCWIAAACAGGQQGAGDAGKTVDAAVAEDVPTPADSGPCATDQVCKKATLSPFGDCFIVNAPNGQSCGGGDPTCTRSCKNGQCVSGNRGMACEPATTPGECFSTAGMCNSDGQCEAAPKPAGSYCVGKPLGCMASGACDGAGTCQMAALPPGTPCPVDSQAPAAECYATAGFCQASGECSASAKPAGTPCKGQPAACSPAGACDGAGACEMAKLPAGSPCTAADADQCHETAGTCLPTGECSAQLKAAGTPCSVVPGPCHGAAGACNEGGMCVAAELPAGTTCTVAAPGACHVNKGTCDSGGLCEPGLAAPGTPCANPDGGVQAGGCSTAACDAAGACKLVPKPSGTQCGAGPYTCSGPAMCDGTGTCIPPTDGTHCFVWYSYPGGTADEGQNLCLDGACASGVCVPKPLVGQACTPPSPDANPCISGVYTCDAKGFCGSATAPGKPCKAQDPCTTNGKCDEKGKCVGDIAVGASCGAAPGPCQLLQCQADGSCKAVATPGLSCSTADPCLVGGKCDVAGQCIGTVPVGASCGAAPGPCLARQCQSDGSCTTVPAPGGACWIDMNPCKSGVCGGDGTCKPVIKVGAVCATGDSCTSGVCDAAGKCALTVHPGNACKMPLTGAVGACLGDGTCQTPCKNGQACQGACGPGLCDASGHCLTPASSGKACKLPAFQNLCVSSCTCNGMGGLDLTTIPDGEPIKVPLKCYAGAICMAGQPIVPPENPQACDDGNPCTSHGCCEGWGEPCPSSIDYSGIAWSSSVDCVHGAGGNGECSGSGCFKRYCGADAFCEILTGPTTDCQKWCSAKCPSAPAPPYTICRTCSADINVDDCPVAWKNVDDGTSCGTNLICKAGQCILK